MKSSNSIIYYIILCFCLLIFIGILRNKKLEKINNIIENFDNSQINVDYQLDKNFTSKYINGFWTTPGTTLNKEKFATDLMEIKLQDKNSYIQLPNIKGNKFFTGLKYSVILSTGMSIISTSSESQYTLSINIIDISKNNNYGIGGLVLTTNVPLAKIIFIDKNNNQLLNINSYKVPEHKKIESSQLKQIIESKSFNSGEIKDIYYIESYIKIIGDYHFLKNSIYFNFGINCNSSPEINNYCNIINNNYGGNLLFRIAREFTAPNGSTIKTQASEIYTLEAIKKIEINKNKITQLPERITIIEPLKDVILNKINYKEYIPKAIIIYFYKATNTTINYNFTDSNKINTSVFKFNNNNNASDMFSKNNVNTNDLNSLTKNINTQHTVTVFKTIFTPDMKNEIIIPFSDIYSYL
jgi:hypothetical protein